MNFTVNKVNNGFLIYLRDPSKLCPSDNDTYIAKDETELLETIRDIIMRGLVTEKLVGNSSHLPF